MRTYCLLNKYLVAQLESENDDYRIYIFLTFSSDICYLW